MSVTGKYFLHSRKGAITQQYPDNRATLQMFERFRGEVVMPHDEKNEHRCTGCQKCELACPNGSIEIIWDRQIDPETGKIKKRGGIVVPDPNENILRVVRREFELRADGWSYENIRAKIISEGLNKNIIEWQSIEAFRELSKSPNSKIIITDGKAPLMIDPKE